MTSDEILFDAEERMEKAVQVLQDSIGPSNFPDLLAIFPRHTNNKLFMGRVSENECVHLSLGKKQYKR